MDEAIQQHRTFLKSTWGQAQIASDQQAGKPQPPLEKPAGGGEILALPKPDPAILRKRDIHACLLERRSRRNFTPEPLSLAEIAYLLFATQGVQEIIRGGKAALRTVPSGGARHPFETYLLINRVAGLEPGICRYLPLSHQLVRLSRRSDLPEAISYASADQPFVGEAAAVFVWTCLPYRAEWRYRTRAHKNILLDAGHLCQNLYLACEALGLGTCAIAAYRQDAFDALLGLDGEDEFVVYLSPVGKL